MNQGIIMSGNKDVDRATAYATGAPGYLAFYGKYGEWP